MTDPSRARQAVQDLADDRRTRGHHITDDQVDRAAALLVDLWAAACRHGISADHWGFTIHLPRAALDAVSAPPLRPRGSLHRPRRWQTRQYQEVP